MSRARPPSPGAPWRRLRRARALLSVGAAVLFGVGASATGCSDCDGQIIDGRCRPNCDDADCGQGGRCYDGVCRSLCEAETDCNGGECRLVRTELGYEGRLCLGEEPREAIDVGGRCSDDGDCDAGAGVRCISDVCTLTCDTHPQCGGLGACTGVRTSADGESVRVCEPDGAPRDPGQFGTGCPLGDECDAASNFVCLGAGPGDIDAYCSTRCAADDDCPVGFDCAEETSSAVPCTDVCGFPGEPTADCVADDRIGPGRDYDCGPAWLTTRRCLRRGFCDPCETDEDCLAIPNRICARDESGEKICTIRCDPSFDSCPWGNATRCAVWDEGRGFATCSHRFGACHGEGRGCEPCRDQSDCPRGFCTSTQFTGERYCVDLAATCACPPGTAATCVDGGCPRSPSGAPLLCYGGAQFEGTIALGACIGAAPIADTAEPDTCWP